MKITKEVSGESLVSATSSQRGAVTFPSASFKLVKSKNEKCVREVCFRRGFRQPRNVCSDDDESTITGTVFPKYFLTTRRSPTRFCANTCRKRETTAADEVMFDSQTFILS